jgi:hypothetical protein
MNDAELLILLQELEDEEDEDEGLLRATGAVIAYGLLESQSTRISRRLANRHYLTCADILPNP